MGPYNGHDPTQNTSLASSVKSKRRGAIDRARSNVREAFASFLEDSISSDADHSNGEETDGEDTSTLAKTPHRANSTPAASSVERSQAFKRRSNDSTLPKSTPTTHRVTSSSRRHDLLETTPPGRMPLSVTTPEDGDTHSNDSQSPDDSVKSALQNITTILNNVVERMDRVERQLSQQNHTPSSSSSEKSARKKPAVPLILRVSCEFLFIVNIYKLF